MRAYRLTGLTDYAAVHALMLKLVQSRADDAIEDTLLFVEHPPVITIGRKRGAQQNVLMASNLPVISVERGGDVTAHGPGQLVAYPIVKLSGPTPDILKHLAGLQSAVLSALQALGLNAHTDPRNTGVWLPSSSGPAQKVCSLGVSCRRGVAYHGLALNLSVQLDLFRRINPCGFSANIMTRLSDHLQPCPTIAEMSDALLPHLIERLHLHDSPLTVGSLSHLSPSFNEAT